ncbi:MAG: hypothetical protein NZ700_11820 [Gemmataceae bacterium]|nr:hypothetical protein [Gemmataceae bacterium]MDW8266852.1 hypothetical protein [Gemmataceae bacterium]
MRGRKLFLGTAWLAALLGPGCCQWCEKHCPNRNTVSAAPATYCVPCCPTVAAPATYYPTTASYAPAAAPAPAPQGFQRQFTCVCQ